MQKTNIANFILANWSLNAFGEINEPSPELVNAVVDRWAQKKYIPAHLYSNIDTDHNIHDGRLI